jgi:hypothetical protein
MQSGLERRLSAALDRPRPTKDATAHARAAALATLPQPSRRSMTWVALVAAAAALGAVGVGAAALAATGKLHVDLGAPTPRPAPVQTRLTLPPRTHGIAIVAGGKLWLATRGGLRIEGMPASTAELSPRALYAVVGLGSSLVAFAPRQRRAWTQRTPGPPLAAAWSPDGLKIAYIVRTRRGAQLRLIEGDGDHDRLLERHVGALRPTWFADSLRIVYARANGRRAIFDLRRGSRTVSVRGRLLGRRRQVARLGDEVAFAVRRPGRILELRLARARATAGQARPKVLLRVRVERSPVTISWR